MVKGLLLAVAGVLVMASCSTSGKTGKSDAAYLDGEWNVTEVNGQNMLFENTMPYVVLNVNDSTLSGNAGCNMINGKIVMGSDNGLSFGPVASTRMMCPEADKEASFLTALNDVKTFEVAHEGEEVDSVMLKNTEGTVVIKLKKRCSIDGHWNITMLGDSTVTAEDMIPFLDFRMNVNKVFGNLGCNSYNSSVELDMAAGKISFGMGAMTQMMCPNADLERSIATALSEVVYFKINIENNKNKLELIGSDGKEVLLVLER